MIIVHLSNVLHDGGALAFFPLLLDLRFRLLGYFAHFADDDMQHVDHQACLRE